MTPRFYIDHHFKNFQPIFDFRGVSESQNDCEENELLKLAITLLVHLNFKLSHPKSTGKVGKTGLYENGYIINVLRLR